MISFIDAHRAEHGVEPICRTLKIAPSTYYEHDARRKRPEIAPLRVQRDEVLKPEIRRVYDQNLQVYGQRKIWKQLKRKGFDIARCTVARLMKNLGLKGFIRGKPHRTTVSDKSAPCPLDRVNRCFKAPAPNILWVADFTYVATWSGFVYVAFVIDVFARRIVGWRASRTAHASFVLDALEQAVHDRRPGGGLVHHSDRGSQLGRNSVELRKRSPDWFADIVAMAPFWASRGCRKMPQEDVACRRFSPIAASDWREPAALSILLS